ncbi:MAG TPA: Tol-Pal system beta propeller repeat protein TolB [Burkholderiaceae bacterium]
MTVTLLRTLVATACAGLFASGAAHAQLKVEISGVGANQIPVAVASFADEGAAPQQISAIVKADLTRSGVIKVIDAGGPIAESAPVNYADWKGRGADALAAGSLAKLANGTYDVRYKLFDTVKATELSFVGQNVRDNGVRLAAHKIADDIYQKLTGTRGMFSTRIAYVVKARNSYRVEVADADGENIQVAITSKEPIISPSWSPDGTKIAYVSFEAKKPIVYVQNLVNGQRTVVANEKGNNSAPAWSPDGSKLAVALSRTGSTQIFLVNADGTGMRRLTNGSTIDTEPQFAPDGQSIYFTSDRGGGPQTYRMSISGGNATRVTFNGDYNVAPRISPDGKYLAYIARRGGRFQTHVLELASGQEQRLSDTSSDESPSFSANSKYVMYAIKAGRGAIGVASVDGRVKYRITMQAGDITEPTWGPFM